MEKRIYDMIVVGGGPGGYTAAMYAARAGLDTVVLEKLSAGGQMALTTQIDNYPGFPEGVDGFDLGMRMQEGAEKAGARTEMTQVVSMDLTGPVKRIVTTDGEVLGRTVALATGASPRKLGLPMEQELVGKGLHYCAHCDGMFYRNKTVIVIGGGNTAAADALLLSRICKKVILVHRRNSLRATKIYHAPLFTAENVEFAWNSEAVELLHGERITGLRIRDTESGQEREILADGVFVSIGREPETALVRDQITLDPQGYIRAGEDTVTNLPGVYAVGDVRTKALRQIVTAVADGAAAAHSADAYLAEQA